MNNKKEKSSASRKKQIPDSPQNLVLTNFLDSIMALGLLESRAEYLAGEEKVISGTTVFEYLEIYRMKELEEKEVISDRMKEKKDYMGIYTKALPAIKKFFNSFHGNFIISGISRKGTGIIQNRQMNKKLSLKEDSVYQAFLSIYLGILSHKGFVSMDIFQHLLQQKYPIDFLSFIAYAIENELYLDFDYFSSRKEANSPLKNFIPIKITLKRDVWYLIGYLRDYKAYRYYKLTGISNVRMSRTQPDEPVQFDKEKALKYVDQVFGTVLLEGTKDLKEITILVPKHKQKEIMKRRKEGVWDDFGDEKSVHWKILSYSVDEVLEYLFQWNGLLRIISPPEAVERYKDRLKTELDHYT